MVDSMDSPSVLWPLFLRTWKKGFLAPANASAFVHNMEPSRPFAALSARRTSGLLGVHMVDLIREESLG